MIRICTARRENEPGNAQSLGTAEYGTQVERGPDVLTVQIHAGEGFAGGSIEDAGGGVDEVPVGEGMSCDLCDAMTEGIKGSEEGLGGQVRIPGVQEGPAERDKSMTVAGLNLGFHEGGGKLERPLDMEAVHGTGHGGTLDGFKDKKGFAQAACALYAHEFLNRNHGIQPRSWSMRRSAVRWSTTVEK